MWMRSNWTLQKTGFVAITLPIVGIIIFVSPVQYIWIMENKNSNISYLLIWRLDQAHRSHYSYITSDLPNVFNTILIIADRINTGVICTVNVVHLFIYLTICSLVGLTVWTDYARLNCHVFSVPVVIYLIRLIHIRFLFVDIGCIIYWFWKKI